MLREVTRLTKGDFTKVVKPLHVKKKALPNRQYLRKVEIPLCQVLKHRLKDVEIITVGA